ncbi:MAG TPA: DUF58 domain-containing protein [Polyangiaceae bacterium]|jgi:uncharacterized protein (DUF58 family)
MSGTLLDPAFTRELEALRRRLRVRARSGTAGDHVASRRGSSAEFLEHRPYAPGDDLRRMDWLAFARTGEPVLKLFRAEEDVVLRLVVDASGSLDTGDPPKMHVAKRVAAAIGYMALASSERAQVLAAGDGLVRMREPLRGRGALAKLLRELDALVPEKGTNLASAIDAVVLRSPRPGMLVVVSDFLDAGPFEAALGRAASAGHDLAMIQVLAPEELDPPWDGDLALEDAETGDVVEVTIDARAVEAYLARLAGLVALLRATAKRHGATYVRLPTVEPLLDAVRRFVARTVD